MHINKFYQQYGSSPTRIKHIQQLYNELQIIHQKGWTFKVYVFGSMVNTRKENPQDIDCLISILNPLQNGIWEPVSEIHCWPRKINFELSNVFSSCRSLSEMVNYFNDNIIKTGEDFQISEEHCIEIEI